MTGPPRPSVAITIRADGETATVSCDDGRTTRIPIHSITDVSRTAAAGSLSGPSASELASIAEAAYASPRPPVDTIHSRSAVRDSPAQPQRNPLDTIGASRPAPPPRHTPFTDLLDLRRSRRDLGPVLADTLLAAIFDGVSTRGAALSDDGSVLRHRGAPSAGARHPVETLVHAYAVPGLEPGTWWIDGDRRLSHKLNVSPEGIAPVIDACRAAGGWEIPAPATVLLIANFDATTARYPAGSTLVWRDAGALAATLHLCFTDAELDSTILGVGGPIPDSLLTALGWTSAKTDCALVGAVAVGARPDKRP